MIYRAIEGGMVSYSEVKSGAVTLAELVEINQWLDMRADIEYHAMQKQKKIFPRGRR